MILIKETYTIIRIKRIILYISLLFNFAIILISICAALKYYTGYQKNERINSVYPIDLELQISYEEKNDAIIYNKEYQHIVSPDALISVILGSLNEGMPIVDCERSAYEIRIRTNGRKVHTCRFQNYKAEPVSNPQENYDSKAVVHITENHERKISYSGISHILLPAH